MKAGDTFRRKDSQDKHLWVVMYITKHHPEECVLVNLTSNRDYKDQSCTLESGDHPFIAHSTVVNYGGATKALRQAIIRELKKGTIIQEESCSLSVLKRIREGALVTRQKPLWLKEMLERYANPNK